MPRGARAPLTAKAKRNLRGERNAVGPFASIILRETHPARPDRLNFSVEGELIGGRGEHVHILARFRISEDAKTYGAILARRNSCRIKDYV